MREDFMFRYTTLGTGGKARVSVAEKPSELCSGAVILGGGSNVLIGQNNLPDFIINKTKGIEFSGETALVASGEKIQRLCALATLKGLSGLEWAWGLPGTLGGAIIGNAGAAGGDTASVIEKVNVVRGGKNLWLSRDECGFSYRKSGFLPGDVIVSAIIKIKKSGCKQIENNLLRAKELRSRQPKGRSAGCIFKNPPTGSIGKMLDELGFKGKREGGAMVSTEHANFIVNADDATPLDVYTLIKRMENAVEKAFGFTPEREIKIYGEF